MSKHRKSVPTLLDNPARIIAQPQTRAWIYAVSIPLLALLVGLGIVTEGTSGLVLDLVAAVLGVGTSALAAANSSRRKDEPGE